MTASNASALGLGVFALTLIGTFVAAWLGRRDGGRDEHGLADERLNKWLIGLSAGAAANSGFVVTGAVGLGYLYGLQWVLLPLAWLLGDVVFWLFFPQRINRFGRRSAATTLSELLGFELPRRPAVVLGVLCALVIVIGLSGYLSAQWLAGQKFLSGAFGVPGPVALGLFALLIVTYTAIGGFRGSVYVDSFQAVLRLVGTTLALSAVALAAHDDGASVVRNLAAAGPHFLELAPGGVLATLGFVVGYASAALGFGLGQPQLVGRYLAGRSPEETQSAWWIYMGFVQFTWIAMSLFGVLLRGVLPGIADPEAGLSVFFHARMNAVVTGVIVADVFATIAATSNALLVAVGQSLTHDLLRRLWPAHAIPLWVACLAIGAATMLASTLLNASVMTLALSSGSLVGAAIAPAVLVKVAGWRHTGASLVGAVCAGLAAALVWKAFGLDASLNVAFVGMAVGLATNAIMRPR